MSAKNERKLIKGVKAILDDEGFSLCEDDNGYNLGYIVTPFGKLKIAVHDDSIFTVFCEHEKIPVRIRADMGVGYTGKWNFHSGGVLGCFHAMFRKYITGEAAWAGWLDKGDN